ncbi:MAG: hypothetical protein FWG53_04755 [Clostridiales bacterium]|nr:hypothetical protein [Clostridiales bacterium]
MANRNFRLIKGGLSSPAESDKKTFQSAFITDTRLMGVVGLYIHWELETDKLFSDFHQFFYFDAEEYGFETYRSICGNDILEINYIENALMGGLGGEKVDLTQKEAIFLLQSFVDMNRRLSIPMPEGEKEYGFLLDRRIELNAREKRNLFMKQCTHIETSYQAINYFLMRCFVKDFEAAEFLSSAKFPLDIYPDLPAATLCKNTIDLFENDFGISYMCESLIESDSAYVLVLSELTVANMRITSFEKRSVMKVSSIEAAMMLSRPEYVTVYEIISSPEEFDVNLAELTSGTLLTVHENGRLFLSFNKNNDHVNRKVFRLNEDVFGLYYVTDYGQLLIAAYNIKGIHAMEKGLRRSPLSSFLVAVSKYEFKEPVLYEFIQSDFDDFEEFLEYIKE